MSPNRCSRTKRRAPDDARTQRRIEAMNQQPIPIVRAATPRPIGSPAEAQQVIGHLSDVMDALLGVVEQDAKLGREGQLSQLAGLDAQRSAVARLYLAGTAPLA